MRFGIVLFALIIVSAVLLAAVPPPQEQEDVRGAFLTSRPKEKTENPNPVARPNRRKPKPTPSPTPKATASPKGPTPTPPKQDSTPARVNTQRIGIGLTLFTRDPNGLAVRVDPTHVFHRGDRVRVLLETNSDGYLYIFNTTNNGPPVMVYPDPELDEAGNYLQAHVPLEIPSSLAAQERLRWLVFDEHDGDERLYFVFSSAALPGVPIEDDLISYCREAKPACPWRPATEVWARIQQKLQQPLQTDKAEHYGKAQTDAERQATTRGIGLAKADAEPSLIMMVASSSNTTLVT